MINHVKDEDATQMSLRSKSVSWRSSVPLKKSTWELSFDAGSGSDANAGSGATSKENSNPDSSETYEMWLINLVRNISIKFDCLKASKQARCLAIVQFSKNSSF